jgi:group I intron endonuclease
MFGRTGQTRSEETQIKMSKAQGTAVEIIDKETNIKTTFTSIRQADKELDVDKNTISRYIKSKKLYKGRYLISENVV